MLRGTQWYSRGYLRQAWLSFPRSSLFSSDDWEAHNGYSAEHARGTDAVRTRYGGVLSGLPRATRGHRGGTRGYYRVLRSTQ
jgi:hypothetical protein